MTKDGQRFFVQMGSCKAFPSFADKLLIHSHPNDYGSGMAKMVSEADIQAIKIFNQEYSYIVTTDGSVYKFTQDTAPNGHGELARELNYFGFGPPNK